MIIWKRSKEDAALVFQREQVRLLRQFRQQVQAYDDSPHLLVLAKLDECLAEIESKRASLLKLVLRVKWLIREIGALLYDRLLVLTAEEEVIWQQTKALNVRYDRFGHGFGLGL